MLSFELLDVFLLVGIVQGIFLAFSLQRVKNTNKSTNRVLASLLILATLMLVGRLVYFRYPAGWPLQLSLLPDVIIFIFGPLSYKFVRKLCFADGNDYRLPRVHFIPAGLQFIVFLFFLRYSGAEYINMWNNGTLLVPFAIIEGAAIALNLFYWLNSWRLLRLFEREEHNTISYTQGVRTFVKFFLFSLLLFYLVWSFSYLNTYFLRTYIGFVNYNAVWIIIPMFIYIITYQTIRQPEFFRPAMAVVTPTSNKMRLDKHEIEVLTLRLNHLFAVEKIYLNESLTMVELAERLQVSTHDASWLLNNVHGMSFYDYVNQHRVEEFIKKIEAEEHEKYTLLTIAYSVGFKSKSTFNKVFKAVVNDTPTNYIKHLKQTGEDV